MLRLLSDENFHGDLVRGLRRALPELDMVRVHDVGLLEADDPAILKWAASAGRILLSHDRKTIPRFAYDRVRRGEPMPGVFLVSEAMPRGDAIAELMLAIQGSSQEEWQDLVIYFPL